MRNRFNQGSNEEIRVRMPRKGEILGIVEAMLGANKLKVRCQDGLVRICRIPGKLRKRVWVRERDIVLVVPWSIQGDKSADIQWRYTHTEAGWLRRKGILKMDV